MIPASASGYLSPQAYQLKNQVCMIPCGDLLNEMPLSWDENQLRYYTNYMLNGQPIDSFFKGFIFNGIRTKSNRHFMYPLYVGFGEPSGKADWLEWIDNLFAPGVNLTALHRLATSDKLDVWVSIPYPHQFQKAFGEIQGRNLDFSSNLDRFAAVIWWIDQFNARWSQRTDLHNKLDFKGFLWQRESIIPQSNDDGLIKWVNGAIASRNQLSMWLPNYGANGVIQWRELGFHVVALNSNYTGNTGYQTNWILNSSGFAKYYHLGTQITFGKGMIYSDYHHLDYFNLGLPNKQNYMKDSFLVYQLPNQTLETVYKERIAEYIRLYTFVKGIYQRVDYPGIAY
ncbi:DUF4855 domain-containing protein [Paenibacillus antibioticophila]|uniref:DUF4855 domain-containing protein n=1 Tax=Paenibacillus antibioticophila TaxID=1274374 RepID=UPI0005CAE292|nr:DUF4855 domain-containing protein [Paenibacillus antibioticophila]